MIAFKKLKCDVFFMAFSKTDRVLENRKILNKRQSISQNSTKLAFDVSICHYRYFNDKNFDPKQPINSR